MALQPIVPPPLQAGDTVAIATPSYPAPARHPHRMERGVAYLESLGLRVKLMPNARGDDGRWTSGSGAERAADIHAAFVDDEVTLVLASIGGNHSNQMIPHLDYDLIRAHPKWFQGYSDNTVLQWALLKHAGLASFYGTALTTGIAEYPKVLDYTDRYLKAAWFDDGPIEPDAAQEWTDEFLDWDTQADLERARTLIPGEGWVAIRGGRATGPLVAGCLETIVWHLKGSTEWLDLEGAILHLETSEEGPSPEHVDAYLSDLDNLGVFDAIAGLTIARPAEYPRENVSVLWDVVRYRTEVAGIPVLANIDCGHTDPMLTMPVGLPCTLDATEMKLIFRSR
ncbi:MAG: muramoyltetrapeptide carboxypeptidase [Actinomycetota bacterium]|jgi:muramoyltetrapeptide carboxypeptidase LdcA involved in peptidoglycan recycling|nr:muramoyltetrapeptide carboxypeptidase [Actinomycetota bacterium]